MDSLAMMLPPLVHAFILEFWPSLVSALLFLVALSTSIHVVLYKRESSAAIGWVGLVWLVPFMGAFLYVLLGINRIQRQALAKRGSSSGEVCHLPLPPLPSAQADALAERVGAAHLTPLLRMGDSFGQAHITEQNRVELLEGGDAAYPAMLSAIAKAQSSVHLSSYIFDNDRAGQMFLRELTAAHNRGVSVRVLIDDVGTRYSFPPMHRLLRQAKVPVARFMPTSIPWRMPYFNLRNHRKLLIVDDAVGFTGGMNIREGTMLSLKASHPIEDLHARLEGPVVTHLQRAFIEDWSFTTGKSLPLNICFDGQHSPGPTAARGIIDGPDENLDTIRLSILAALAAAQKRISIITPYFLPDEPLVSALAVCARRGVELDILLPERSNLALVQWATMATLWQVLEHGCRVWVSPPPFDHTKLMVVDNAWTLLGSANWDPRSLRLNFEFNVECFDPVLANRAEEMVRRRMATSRRLTLQDVNSRRLGARLRDGVARLFSPYL